jgi:hypothetical protein
MVGNRDRVHPTPLDLLYELVYATCAIEEGVLGMAVEVGEINLGFTHLEALIFL